ncbi:MAG TPA: serine hydrolase [Chthoniobacteraceae bacterium]|nr:serine hydrolase [Chthoniobacteraceae bacterium]
MSIFLSRWWIGTVGLVVIALAAPRGAHGKAVPDDLDAYIGRGMEQWHVPGLAIAVVKEGEVVLARGYGVREAGRPEPVDADTLFAIGSTTKAFTATAIGTLVDAGKLAWDAHVAQLWPEFRLSDPWVTKEIRVSDLLANHSGLSPLSELLWYGTGYDRAEILRRLAAVPLDEGFRYRFGYRNTMFLAAGELIPKVDGRSWDEYVARVLFEPLGMERTFATEAGIDTKENVARPHLIDYEGAPVAIAYRDMANIAPAGSIISSVRDMARWVGLNLAEGKAGDRQIVQPATLRFIHRSQTPLGTTGPNDQPLFPGTELPAYALAWVTESYRGARIVWHNGGIDGMSAWVGFLPDRQLGVVILSNLENCDLRKAIFYHLADHALGGKGEDLTPRLLQVHREALASRDQEEKTWRELGKNRVTAELALEKYAGRYAHPALGEVEIAFEKDGLSYRRTREQQLDLRASEKNRFLGRYEAAAEDLRSGKVNLVFSVEEGRAAQFVEDGLATFRRVE